MSFRPATKITVPQLLTHSDSEVRKIGAFLQQNNFKLFSCNLPRLPHHGRSGNQRNPGIEFYSLGYIHIEAYLFKRRFFFWKKTIFLVIKKIISYSRALDEYSIEMGQNPAFPNHRKLEHYNSLDPLLRVAKGWLNDY